MKSYLYKLILVVIVGTLLNSGVYATGDYSRLIELEILKGDEYGLRLDDIITRKELAVIIARVMGESKYAENYPVKSIFSDVNDSYYSSYISWAYSKGFFDNIKGQKFSPNESISDTEFEREILKVLGFSVPEKYINYKAKELDIDISSTEEVTRKMMASSLSKALDVNINLKNITLYENLIEKRLEKSRNPITNIEVVSSKNIVVEFMKSISIEDLNVDIVDKSNPFKNVNIKNVEFLGESKYLLNLSRMESDKEYYLKYDGTSYPFSPKKNTESSLYVKRVEMLDLDSLLVEFSERVIISTIRNKENYGIDGIEIKNIDLYEDLRTIIISTEDMKNKEYYNFYIENIEGLSGTELEREEFVLVGDKDNDKPNLYSAEIISNDLLKLIFTDKRGIDINTVKNINNYKIVGDSGNVKIKSIKVLEEKSFDRTAVIIETSDLPNNENFLVEVLNIYDTSINRNKMDERKFFLKQNNYDVMGPEIIKVEALGINSLNIKISDESSIDKSKIFDAGNYHIDGGVQITNVSLEEYGFNEDEGILSLVIETSNMERNHEYSIYLDNITDKHGNEVISKSVTFLSKFVDNVSPKISEIEVIDKNTVSIKFDEKINMVNSLNTENYVIDNLVGNPNQVIYDKVDDRIILKVSDLKKDNEYLLSVKNIMDYNMNEMGTKSYSFVYKYVNTEYGIKDLEFLNSNLIKVDFNSNVENVDNLKLEFKNNIRNEVLVFNSIWYRDENKSVVYFKGEKPFKENTAYTLEDVSQLFVEHKLGTIAYFNDSVLENNKILGYKIHGNNELVIYLSEPFYVNEDEISSRFIDYELSPYVNSINLKFEKSFDEKSMYLNLGFIKNISAKGFYNSNDYSGRHKFVVDFKNVNPVDYIEVYNYYNISVFHDTPVFGKYYKIYNVSDDKEIDILNVRVDDNNSKKVNILINERLEEDDKYTVKVYSDSQYTSLEDVEDFSADFDQYLVAKVIDNNTIEIYDNYVNPYSISLYQVDSNYKKIGNNLAISNEKIGSKYVVKTAIELLEKSDYLLDYGASQIYLKGKASMIGSQVSVIPNSQYTGKIIVDKDRYQDEIAEGYVGRLFNIATMEEIKIYDGIENQYLIKEPVNVGDKVLLRLYDGDEIKYSSQVVIKDGIKDFYVEYFDKIDRYDPDTIIEDLIELSKETAYFSKDDIKSKNALYYIDNLKVKNEYTIYELYSIIKGVNSYYGSSEKEDVEDIIMNLENFTYTLDDDRTISYSLSNYSIISKELKRKLDKLPEEEKSSYISRLDNIEKRLTDSISISKVLLGREKILNEVNSSTYFTPIFYNTKGIILNKALLNDRISIEYEWEVLKYEEEKYTYSRDIDNITVENNGQGVSITINQEDGTEGRYKVKLKVIESIFSRSTVEVLGEGELIIQ